MVDYMNHLSTIEKNEFVCVRGAREHNLKGIDVDVPRNRLVVFTGISGSGKSTLAFGTLYAEAQRRYLESVSPYARRLFHQMDVPEVESVTGLPPAIALQQQRGGSSGRSTVGSMTTLLNLLRMLYSRAGTYPDGVHHLDAESFSPNTPKGACMGCQGLGRIQDVTEASAVPDQSLSIRNRAIVAWPSAWQGQNLRDILMSAGVDIDIPWEKLSKETRNWILFSDDTPTFPVYPGSTYKQVKRAITQGMEPSYMGTFTSVRRHVLRTFSNSHSASMRRRAQAFISFTVCPQCHGQRLNEDALKVTFGKYNISEMVMLTLQDVVKSLQLSIGLAGEGEDAKSIAARRIIEDIKSRIAVLAELGLGYLHMDRTVQTLSPGEYQRLRLGTQIYSNLFGVVYILDEPSAGLHPIDTQALLKALYRLRDAGNSLFLVEHNLDIIRQAEWVVDVGPKAGSEGGEVLYSGSLQGLRSARESSTRKYLFNEAPRHIHTPRAPSSWLRLTAVTWNNLDNLSISFPLGALTVITGVSGSGKSSLISQALPSIISKALCVVQPREDVIEDTEGNDVIVLRFSDSEPEGLITEGLDLVKRLLMIDQKPIGRTPRSNLATYTGLFDIVRKLYASTTLARRRKYDAGHFSFNLAKGRCETCEGAGSTMVELLFLPNVYATCTTCHGARYSPKILEVKYRGRTIADVLQMTVDDAFEFLKSDANANRILNILKRGGLGYLKLGQPATELSGGEAQRIKLATELQKQKRGHTLYVLDEPAAGLHPADADRLIEYLHELVHEGNTVIIAEHDMRLAARSDWLIDIGPGAGINGGHIVAQGTPKEVANSKNGSVTAQFLTHHI